MAGMIQTSICAAVKGLPRGAVPSHGSGRVGGSIIMGLPQKLVGLFHGKSENNMDDLGVPP